MINTQGISNLSKVQKEIKSYILDKWHEVDENIKNIILFDVRTNAVEAKPSILLSNCIVFYRDKYAHEFERMTFRLEGYGITEEQWGLFIENFQEIDSCFAYEINQLDLNYVDFPERLGTLYFTVLNNS